MSARRVQLVLITLAVFVLGVLGSVSAFSLGRASALAGVRFVGPPITPPTPVRWMPASTSTSSPATTTPATVLAGASAREVFVITDSVVLGVKDQLAQRLAGWEVTVEGQLALSVEQATASLRRQRPQIAPVVVVALGHNSLWERNRRNYDRWAELFDRQADELIAELRSLGAKRIVWLTVRELDADIVPSGWRSQLPRYGFFFPYVNERLRALTTRNHDVTLADWSALAQRPGITRDAIHLNEAGASLMVDLIASALGVP